MSKALWTLTCGCNKGSQYEVYLLDQGTRHRLNIQVDPHTAWFEIPYLVRDQLKLIEGPLPGQVVLYGAVVRESPAYDLPNEFAHLGEFLEPMVLVCTREPTPKGLWHTFLYLRVLKPIPKIKAHGRQKVPSGLPDRWLPPPFTERVDIFQAWIRNISEECIPYILQEAKKYKFGIYIPHLNSNELHIYAPISRTKWIRPFLTMLCRKLKEHCRPDLTFTWKLNPLPIDRYYDSLEYNPPEVQQPPSEQPIGFAPIAQMADMDHTTKTLIIGGILGLCGIGLILWASK